MQVAARSFEIAAKIHFTGHDLQLNARADIPVDFNDALTAGDECPGSDDWSADGVLVGSAHGIKGYRAIDRELPLEDHCWVGVQGRAVLERDVIA